VAFSPLNDCQPSTLWITPWPGAMARRKNALTAVDRNADWGASASQYSNPLTLLAWQIG
jgi:hypothetical protein